jgi:hypothetical protein
LKKNWVFLLFGLLAASCAARADEPPPVPLAKPAASQPPPAEPAAPASVGEVKPEVFYIRDKDNRLIPVPGFSYDDFIKYYRLKEQLDRPEIKPRYNLEQMSISGATVGDRAELTVALKILLLDSEWVRIPLRMNKCALREPAGYKGSGDEFLQYEQNGDGYVCWLRGSPRGEHALTLKFLVPLVSTASETRLELALPRAAASKFTLRVPTANVAASIAPGDSLPEIAADGTGSQLSVLGVSGDFWLAWRAPDQPASRLSSALEANGQMFVKIDGRSVSSEATLTVRSFGAEFDHFRVRLPPAAQLTGGQQAGYTLTPVGQNASLVEVKLDHKTVGPIDIRLLTERAYDVTKGFEILELAGFEIPEAIAHRQWGNLAVAVSGDWQLVWGERTRVRQVDELPDGLRRKNVVAGFEYFGQPSSLTTRVVPRKTRVSVEPQYTYRVGPERTDLEARFKYAIRGARLFKLEMDLPGWEIDSIEPENLIDANSVSSGQAGAISIPLAQPSTGDLELTLKAHRRNASGMKAIEWTLPEPHADVLGPAEVTVISADNVELTPQTENLVGLSRSTGVASSAEFQTAPLSYRAEQARAKFAADFTVHPQSVTVEMDSEVALRVHQIEVTQILNYQVRYEPLDRLSVEVPRSLFDERKLRFSIGGETVEAHELGEQPAVERRSVQLPLKQLTTGPIRLEIHFTLPQQNLVATSSTSLAIPMVTPTDAQVTANTASLVADAGIRLEQREGPWSVTEAKNTPGPQPALHLAAPEAAPELRLALSLDEGRTMGATYIDRAWIQSWLTENVRQDRAVYNFTSDEDQLRVLLPAGIAASGVEAALDGKEIAPTMDAEGAIVVGLPTDAVRREHLLQLRYQFEARSAPNGWLSFDTPRFDHQVKVRRTYWQLVVPVDENLLSASRDLAAEFNWAWRDDGLGFERFPVKEQRQLEQWVGLMAADNSTGAANSAGSAKFSDELPKRTNRYLFSSIGSETRFEVVIVRRWLLLLTASLGMLLTGLALMYVPPLRSPRVILAAAVMLLIAVLIWPDPMVLLAQAASVGLCLAVLALMLRRLVGRPGDITESTARAPASPTLERSSKRLAYRASDERDAATTTASIAVEVSADDEAAYRDHQSEIGEE